jgi:hypothetical protein
VGERGQEGSRSGPGVLSEDGTASEDEATEHASVMGLHSTDVCVEEESRGGTHSMRTIAAMVSTMGTARGRTQGS